MADEQAGEAARQREVESAEAASAQREELRELTAAMAAQQSQLARLLEMQTQHGVNLVFRRRKVGSAFLWWAGVLPWFSHEQLPAAGAENFSPIALPLGSSAAAIPPLLLP